MDHKEIARAFGFSLNNSDLPPSLYAYSPVYKLRRGSKDWVLKKTAKDAQRAQAIQNWLTVLDAAGVPVVTAKLFSGPNPRAFEVGEETEHWVVYPFISGHQYSASLAQLSGAGTMLGRIHSVEQPKLGLPQLQSIVPIEESVFLEDQETILNCVAKAQPQKRSGAKSCLDALAHSYYGGVMDRLIQESFPQVNGPWDFKASNLIYPMGENPCFIDPDNAGFIPRVYDLAIAALLFHNDGVLAQSHVLSSKQWRAFLDAYLEQVTLTVQEQAHWKDVLLAVWMDEALWLLANHEEGWSDPRQCHFLHGLLFIDFDQYSLT